MTSARNSWSTPSGLFAALHARHRFTVDACAEPWNAKLSRWWGWDKDLEVYEAPGRNGKPEILSRPAPGAVFTDGLKQDWHKERVFCNPPYGRGLIEPWVEKALAEATYVVLLLPSRTGTAWFQRLWCAYDVGNCVDIDFLPGRIRFVLPPGIKASSPTEDSLIVTVRR